MKRFRWMLALAVLATLWCGAACARELTQECAYSGSRGVGNVLHVCDGDASLGWKSSVKQPWLRIDAPEGQPIAGVYVCFDEIPASWEIRNENDEPLAQGGDYLHAWVELPAQSDCVKLVATSGSLSIAELRVFGVGALPDDVQRWQPTPAKADLMVLVAHPDDEFLYIGGTIPYYARERGKHVAVVYMTGARAVRRHELLNGLWTAGLREYPIIGDFPDIYSRTLAKGYHAWAQSDVDAFLVKCLRCCKPDVLVTHDLEGEYGHGAHRVCADAAIRVCERLDDKLYYPQYALKYGAWAVKKLYLHLYRQHAITMDWRQPIASMDGRTPLELAQAAFACHESQQGIGYFVGDDYEYSCARFGLYASAVGWDTVGGDFLENIE